MKTRILFMGLMVLIGYGGMVFISEFLALTDQWQAPVSEVTPAPQAMPLFASIDLPRARLNFFAGDQATSVDPNPEDIAAKWLQAEKESLRIQPYHELRPQVFRRPLDTRVVYQVFQDGLLINGLSLEVLIKDGQPSLANNAYAPVMAAEGVNAHPLSNDLIEKIAEEHPLSKGEDLSQARPILFLPPGGDAPIPAVMLRIQDPDGVDRSAVGVFSLTDGLLLGREFSRK